MIFEPRKYKKYSEDENSIRKDEIFKMIFGNNLKSHYLKSLLEALLNINITNIIVRNEVALNRKDIDSKQVKLDILVEIDKKDMINIEMQTKVKYNNIINRSEVYASNVFADNFKIGNDYANVSKTIAIWILDENLFDDGPYHEQSELIRKSNNKLLSDNIIYHYFQLPRFIEQTREIKTHEEQWLAYLSNQLNKEELEELFKMNEDIEDVDKIIEFVAHRPDIRMAISNRILAEMDRNQEKYAARMEGRDEGLDEGRKESKIEIAKTLKEIGDPIEKIMKVTGLTKEEIEKL